ncbi:phosphocholine-specific phospholipase C [Arachidicoccus terrestris]|uniref:phosphocholine-specific phospholipase C n=1 Tax=Arachidicoccus terrestris TaxID=2875539 RepID=UPI001CC50E2E|nr:phospholipase C, phosphocholine-specific [Arachidicoccus terrestris]UAY55508.1 phospholipase C, phosphocholine-specific [Arachidicoccus terrestris]
MDTRRDFLKKAILLSGSVGISSVLPAAIRKALSIDPQKGSTYLDAAHIVILMQENRSFDHCFGMLKGVRGFNDPRAVRLPNGRPVWCQSYGDGTVVPPFRLNIKETKSAWTGSLPHSRASQIDAWNNGQYDRWLETKRSGNKQYKDLPLTMGYYNREDLPFDYALADAFTVCDHNFCSLMGSTTPNRAYFWTGKITHQEDWGVKAYLDNKDYAFGRLEWKTFPELLQDHNISWKFYQNDLYCGALMSRQERDWLLNFGCNILEFWKAYNVKFSSRYTETIRKQIEILEYEITFTLGRAAEQTDKIKQKIIRRKQKVKTLKMQLAKWSQENFDKLTEREKELFHNAFITNKADADYRSLSTFRFNDQVTQREVTIPKGDILYQFRKDVEEGKLATVNWLAAPKYFSDHPTVPWYGTWYTAEILNILTQNPEVWRKTIFILTFDENDGYFDHIPPFTVPDPAKPDTGLVSEGINTEEEWIRIKDQVKAGVSENSAREAPIGLGFRVPMIIASPWSRGGKVCSEVFDHSSTLQFLEHFINKKFNKDIHIENISQWRRSICGNLSSAFTPFEEAHTGLPLQTRNQVIEEIYGARFKQLPNAYRLLSAKEAAELKGYKDYRSLIPVQEPGTKLSCALPYELYVDGNLSENGAAFDIRFMAGDQLFKDKATGAPFTAYVFGTQDATTDQQFNNRFYGVRAGDQLSDSWKLNSFTKQKYHIEVHGPNGFFRSFKGGASDPKLLIKCSYESEERKPFKLTGHVLLTIISLDETAYDLLLDNKACSGTRVQRIRTQKGVGKRYELVITSRQHWYDFTIKTKDNGSFVKRFAGKVETGEVGITDPVMGGIGQ